MSGTHSSGRRLLWRVGPYRSARRPRESVGSVCTVIVELIETETGQLAQATALSAIAWRPRLGGYATQAVPLTPVLLTPGRWQVEFLAEMPGTYAVQAVTVGEPVETTTARIEAA